MNYLAHIYLSGDDEELKIGNCIADSVKGKQFINYPPGVQKGIILHRAIDTYTDAHPTVRKSTHRLFTNYSHYSSVIVDIYYDHFLASNWEDYSNIPLKDYVKNFYVLLQKNKAILPRRVKHFLPIMVEANWLLNYASLDGIGKILWQMNHRTGKRSKMDQAVEDLKIHYSLFENEFKSFFEDLEAFTKEHLPKL